MATVKKKVAKKKVVKKKTAKKSLPAKIESNLPALAEDATPTQTVMHSLMMSMEKGLAPEELKLVLDAQERVLDRQAEQDYQIAMVDVQTSMPAIYRNAERDNIEKNYADLDQIIRTITPEYTQQGFSLSFYSEDSPMNGINDQKTFFVRVCCDVMHRGGWKKKLFVDVPYDLAGPQGTVNKSMTHGAGSAFAYGRRYLTAMIFNLATSDDDDGNSASGIAQQELSEEQLADLETMIGDAQPNMKAFLKFAGSKTVEGIKLKNYDKCVQMLQKKINQSSGEIVL